MREQTLDLIISKNLPYIFPVNLGHLPFAICFP